MQSLKGRRVLITGSSSGVGLALAKRFKKEGAIVALHSHLPREQCPELNKRPFKGCKFLQQDLTDLQALPKFIKEVWSELGAIDVLICNAGMYNEPHFLELTPERLIQVHTLNCLAPMMLIKEWAKLCKKYKIKGSAICTSSINARLSEACHVAYDSSKAALEGAVRAIAIDLAKLRIKVNAVALGLVYTPLTAPFIDQNGIREQLDRAILLGVSLPNDVTSMYVHLASTDSGATTGAVLDVTGGLSASQATFTIG